MKREEPSTESPSVSLTGNVVYRKADCCRVAVAQVLLIVAMPRAGVRPFTATGTVASNFLGVGLLGNAAQSGW